MEHFYDKGRSLYICELLHKQMHFQVKLLSVSRAQWMHAAPTLPKSNNPKRVFESLSFCVVNANTLRVGMT